MAVPNNELLRKWQWFKCNLVWLNFSIRHDKRMARLTTIADES